LYSFELEFKAVLLDLGWSDSSPHWPLSPLGKSVHETETSSASASKDLLGLTSAPSLNDKPNREERRRACESAARNLLYRDARHGVSNVQQQQPWNGY
jgi:hypothetical protein